MRKQLIAIALIMAIALPVWAVRKFSGTTALQKAQIYGVSGLPTAGASVTNSGGGELRRQVFKGTVTFDKFKTAGVTSDVTIATLPAKTIVYRMFADVTVPFVCAATCTTSTLSMTCGKSAGGNEYVLSFDADAAAATFGDAIAEMGASLTAATTPVSSGVGDVTSMSATTTLQCRMTSGTGNIGNGTVSNFNAGTIVYYLDYAVLP